LTDLKEFKDGIGKWRPCQFKLSGGGDLRGLRETVGGELSELCKCVPWGGV